MRSRELKTVPEVLPANYTFKPLPSGEILHRFTPQSTATVYQFIGPNEPLLEEGHAYNIGYSTVNGINWVDKPAITRADEVNQHLSHRAARERGERNRAEETRKSNQRVRHSATDGRYLGRKYAWRIYGLAVPKRVFYAFMDSYGHPYVECVTNGTQSVAYKDAGLADAMDAFISSCVRVSGNRFTSPLLRDRKYFTVNGITAITDKK
jgi:hypothetical protein